MKVKIQHILPEEIEKRSFELIEEELSTELDTATAPIVKRCIHTSADFDYEKNLVFSQGVVDKAINAIREGAVIITDTNMVKAGINKNVLSRYGSEVVCFMADDDVKAAAKQNGTTRAVASMEKAVLLDRRLIFAIGNAPTALIRLYEMVKEKKIQPELIIGVPVGFVNVVESKELILSLSTPFIVARGRKGGSNIAAAICNAILYMME